MLGPYDFDKRAINHPVTRALMAKMTFEWGGTEYDAKYPDGIPTSIIITDEEGRTHDSGLVMYPAGHARNTTADLKDILNHKWRMLGSLGSAKPDALIARLSSLEKKSAQEIGTLYDFEIQSKGKFE
jgi:2-methylcitrate dehydratase